MTMQSAGGVDMAVTQHACRSRGFTLVELMVTVAIAAIFLSIAAPGFSGYVERKRVQGLASVLATEMELLKGEALKRNRALTISFSEVGFEVSDADGIYTKSVTYAELFPGVTAEADFDGDGYTFDPVFGRLVGGDGGSVTVSNSTGSLEVRVGVLGRPSICGGLGGYSPC